jgi:hypothetical protein
VAPIETYLQEAGVLSQEAGQPLQGSEVARAGGYKFLGEKGCQVLGHSAIHRRVDVSLHSAQLKTESSEEKKFEESHEMVPFLFVR